MDINSERRFFNLTVFKKLYEKPIYKDLEECINQNMSDSNVGAQKNMKCEKPFIHRLQNYQRCYLQRRPLHQAPDF